MSAAAGVGVITDGQYRALREVAVNGGLWLSRLHSGSHAPGFVRATVVQALRAAKFLETVRVGADDADPLGDAGPYIRGHRVRLFLTATGAVAMNAYEAQVALRTVVR